MEVEEDLEDYSVGGLLSPERRKVSNNEDEVFVFKEEKKFFESKKEILRQGLATQKFVKA